MTANGCYVIYAPTLRSQRFTVRYLAVYTKSGDHWRMIAWQSTRQPEA
jgi:hypothetical protein